MNGIFFFEQIIPSPKWQGGSIFISLRMSFKYCLTPAPYSQLLTTLQFQGIEKWDLTLWPVRKKKLIYKPRWEYTAGSMQII